MMILSDDRATIARVFPAVVGILCLVVGSTVLAQATFTREGMRDGQAGFVVSHIEYALGHDAEKTGACPEGFTQGYGEDASPWILGLELQRQEDESTAQHGERVYQAIASGGDAINLCLNPELGAPDPGYKVLKGSQIPAYGINLTGHVARRDSPPLPGTCAYDSFVGMDGEEGIDNQYFRVVGCRAAYQSTGSGNSFAIEMLTGAWGIVIILDHVDDIVNDDHVEVGIHANADPIRLSPSREPLEYATYAIHRDSHYQTRTTGRIVDGVLSTDPVDMRFQWTVNSMIADRPLRDARIQATLSEDGILEGYLAGYTPVEAMYDMSYGFRNAREPDGELSPLSRRIASAVGKARVQGYTCEGAYHALLEHADGHPDPETGLCTSISTQYRITAIPAFVVGPSEQEDQNSP